MKEIKRTKEKIIKTAIVCLVIAVIILTGVYMGRNTLLTHIVHKRIQQIEQTYGLRIRYDELKLKSIDELVLQNLSVVPTGRDTLLVLRAADVKLNFQALLRRKIELRYVQIDGLNIRFIKKGFIANYDFLFMKRASKKESKEGESKAYSQQFGELSNLLFGLIPENGRLSRLQITEQKDSNFVSVVLPAFLIENKRFRTTIEVREDTLLQHWNAIGEINHRTQTLQTELFTQDGETISLPYIIRRFGAKAMFNRLSFSLAQQKTDSGISLNGKASITGLTLFHKALSPESINLNQGQFTYQLHIGDRSIELDSTTAVTFNKLTFHPYFSAEQGAKGWHFKASINKTWFPANQLFDSLPKGLFGNLEGIKTSGELAYHFLLDIDWAALDSLKFESKLTEKNFRIDRYGATNLSKMCDEFIYTAYENGQPVRTFPIGTSWEHFTPLDSISPLLQMSILQSEDGAFYYHTGFLPDAMREALIHDLKVKRFARGGSTITMQLVKNVFLTRNKNFARKLEEALLVWLIETKHLTPKARMYEVYLNIAEWGPLIYGIHEASQFYFNKRPSQLTTEESIFLASILPKPKQFRRSFTENGQLKENMERYYRLIAERLVKKGLIQETEADSIRPSIEVRGVAKEMMK